MEGEINYTPLDTFKLSAEEKKPKKFTNHVLTGLIIFFVIGIGTIGYLLVLQQPIKKDIPATTVVDLTPTISPPEEIVPTGELIPSEETPPATDEAAVAQPAEESLTPTTSLVVNPTEAVETRSLAQSTNLTPTAAPDPTETPIPLACGTKSCDDETNPCKEGLVCVQADDGSNYCSQSNYQTACKADPSQESCCTAPVGGGEEPSPTEIVLVTDTSNETASSDTTSEDQPEIPSAGIATFGVLFGLMATGIIIFGLIF
ncbi:hypothetical protein A2774_05440 [Candidatus Roizmanbacteria bacterium RIFCSPHIGHO2_01_FULL_39_12c]|uniref:Uncharacterized protein n=1 Tax=Candidatus Roizmanbacteria bacterium RIFCSPHIGHO2_01_FULL_39_12c TaxID=1802031 RepID=A0A1F7GEV5_9BACT|nr:MAG: hypothetical protein A2774_05440 [Candidatus Roizmanbacteria bacterium RIFCSPHIGHO2_01_FULL_39_12c]OGK46729.1 MAG: hypothetical protein A2963_00665 [Candidatus Roizmanbacteria bacterium RIFCSPLOWO2_01_FULL_40_13]